MYPEKPPDHCRDTRVDDLPVALMPVAIQTSGRVCGISKLVKLSAELLY